LFTVATNNDGETQIIDSSGNPIARYVDNTFALLFAAVADEVESIISNRATHKEEDCIDTHKYAVEGLIEEITWWGYRVEIWRYGGDWFCDGHYGQHKTIFSDKQPSLSAALEDLYEKVQEEVVGGE